MTPTLPSYLASSSSTLGLAATVRQWVLSSMLIRVPLHYLKRRGVATVLLGMILFAYLHEFLLRPSTDVAAGSSSTSSSSSAASRLPYHHSSSDHDPDDAMDQDSSSDRGGSSGGWFSDLFNFGSNERSKGDPEMAHILERPEQGAGPLKGVDEDGLEIVDDAYLVEQHSSGDQADTDQGPLRHSVAPFINLSNDIVIQYPFSQQPVSAARQAVLAERQQFIQAMIRHAWTGYVQSAAPSDELRSVTGKPQHFAGGGYNGWAATAVDSMDTLLLAGLDQEYQEARRIVLDAAQEHGWTGTRTRQQQQQQQQQQPLSTDPDNEDHGIAVADTISLYLGGLLSSAELGQDQELLGAAKKVAQTLLVAFKGPQSGLPSSVLFRNGTTRTNPTLRGKSSLAETGSFQLEFRHLSRVTGDQEFTKLNLLKTFMLTGDVRFKDLYIAAVDAMHAKLISRAHDKDDPSLVLGIYDTYTDSLVPKMDHLTCYESYAKSPTGLGAEEIAFLATPFQQGKEFERPSPQEFYVLSAGYELRPGNAKYQDYAWNIAQAIEKQCKTSYGYSTLVNVKDSSEGMSDYMPSYFLAATLKYLYLIFSSPDKASLDKVLFTTQGHLVPYHQ
ncbi:Endoplasmic reticulum mannosyl-oligosaccharide 1,2-alpha-mannosidase [Actinomortierella ambigua]|nr:Endoplasmic reticulum mannosyl-oligosaccharide 1,2-alpha-mannosidase [Actinomortierella ambigua]